MRKLKVKQISNIDGNWLILENDAIGQNLLDGKRWEPHFTDIAKKLIPQGSIAVDCGANMGHHTVVMANIVGENGFVHAIEPLRVIFQQLNANVFNNGLTNVKTYNIALGNRGGVSQMNPVNYFADWVNIGDTEVGRGGDEILVTPLDVFELRNVSFIKIDVQGSEVLLLDGAKETIQKNSPILFIEVEDLHLRNFGTSPKELLNKIREMDYDIYHIITDYPVDHLCIPRDKKEIADKLIDCDLYKVVKI
jgi:FkbM family methyltransferase